jgi:hypothetical protein
MITLKRFEFIGIIIVYSSSFHCLQCLSLFEKDGKKIEAFADDAPGVGEYANLGCGDTEMRYC